MPLLQADQEVGMLVTFCVSSISQDFRVSLTYHVFHVWFVGLHSLCGGDNLCLSMTYFVCDDLFCVPLTSVVCRWHHSYVVDIICVSATHFVLRWHILCAVDILSVSMTSLVCRWHPLCVDDIICVSMKSFLCRWHTFVSMGSFVCC